MAETNHTNSVTITLPPFLDPIVHFPETDTSYEVLRELAEYRVCHEGVPNEARMVFTCRDVSSGDEFILTVKIQVPREGEDRTSGPSNTTAVELDALTRFKRANLDCAPHLIVFQKDVQSYNGPLPGGYVTYTVMTKMPGDTLLNLEYWDHSKEERDEIVKKFLEALRKIMDLGIEPIDRGLRNIMWDPVERECNIIDFELVRQSSAELVVDQGLLYLWGLADMPQMDWYKAWALYSR